MELLRMLIHLAMIIGIIALGTKIIICVQRAIIDKDLWAVAVVVGIIELIFLKMWGAYALIYTAYRWDKARKA